MQLPREVTTTQPDELILQLSPSQLLIRSATNATSEGVQSTTNTTAMHQISPKIESTDSNFNNNNNNNGHSDVSRNCCIGRNCWSMGNVQ
jgi:hypothetical protein